MLKKVIGSFQQIMLRKLDVHMQKNEVESCLEPYIEVNSKWVKDINIRDKAIKLSEENMGEKLPDYDSHFSNVERHREQQYK